MEQLTDIQEQILNGHLLGDGSLRLDRKNSCFKLTRAIVDKEYLLWTANHFSGFLSSKSIIERDRFHNKTKKVHRCIELTTKASENFTKFRDIWYPNKTKIIPSTLKLTPLTIAVWMADDGNVRKTSTNSIHITLHTEGFEYNNVLFLYEQLKDIYGPRININKKSGTENYIIVISHSDTTKNIFTTIYDIFPPVYRKLDFMYNCL